MEPTVETNIPDVIPFDEVPEVLPLESAPTVIPFEQDVTVARTPPDMSPTLKHFDRNLGPTWRIPMASLDAPDTAETPGAPVLTSPPVVPPQNGRIMPMETPKVDKRKVRDLGEVIEASFGLSLTGLLLNKQNPDAVVDPDAPFLSKLAGSAAQVAGDLPAMAYGGAQAASAAFQMGLGPKGAAVASAAGAWGAPAAFRKIIMDQYERGDVDSFHEFWNRASDTLMEGLKGTGTGVVVGSAGKFAEGYLGKLAEKKVINPFLAKTGVVTTEAAALTGVGAALEGHIPQPEDFFVAWFTIGGLHAMGVAPSKLRDIYAKTGIRPEQVAAEAQSDPVLQQELMSKDPDVPLRYRTAEEVFTELTYEEELNLRTFGVVSREGKLSYAKDESVVELDRTNPAKPAAEQKVSQEPSGIEMETQGELNLETKPLTPIEKVTNLTTAYERHELSREELNTEARKQDPYLFDKIETKLEQTNALKSKQSELMKLATSPLIKDAERILEINKELAKARSAKETEKTQGKVEELEKEKRIIHNSRGTSAEALVERALGRRDEILAQHAELESQITKLKFNQKDQRRIARAYKEAERKLRKLKVERLIEIPLEVEGVETSKIDSDLASDAVEFPPLEVSKEAKIELAELDQPEQLELNLDQKTIDDLVLKNPALGDVIDLNLDAPPSEPPLPPSEPPAYTPPPNSKSVADIIWDGKPKKNKADIRDAYVGLYDDKYMLSAAEKDIFGGDLPSAEKSGYKLMRMSGDYVSSVYKIFHVGMTDVNGNLTGGKSLRQIFRPWSKERTAFSEYLIARRLKEVRSKLDEKGEKYIVSNKEVPDSELDRVLAEGKDKYEESAKAHTDYHNELMYKVAVESQLLSKDGATKFEKENPNYMPIIREKAKNVGPVGGSAKIGSFERFKGSERNILDPAEASVRVTARIMKAAKLQMAKLKFRDNLLENQKEGGEFFIERVGTVYPEKGSKVEFTPVDSLAEDTLEMLEKIDVKTGEFSVMENGRLARYKTTPEIAEAFSVSSKDPASQSIFWASLRALAKLQRTLITANPVFMANNFTNDQFTAGTFTKVKQTPFLSSILVAGEMFQGKSDLFYEYLSSGAGNKEFTRFHDDYATRNIFEDSKTTGELLRLQNVARTLGEKIDAAGAYAEQITRFATYKAGRKAGYSVQESAFMARESTLDFQRVGKWIKGPNQYLPFFNIGFQGTDRFVRSFLSGGGKTWQENTARTLLQGAALISSFHIASWWANKDDPMYQELDQRRKDMFINLRMHDWQEVGERDDINTLSALGLLRSENGKMYVDRGYFVSIPNGRELSVVFGGLPTRLLDAFYRQNPRAFDGFGKNLADSLFPGFNTPVISGMEVVANHNFFTGRSIVPEYLEEGMLPKDVQLRYTSSTAKVISNVLSQIGNRSSILSELAFNNKMAPPYIDHLMLSWSGSAGKMILGALDVPIDAMGLVTKTTGEKPASSWWKDSAIMRGVITTNGRIRSASLEAYEDRFEKSSKSLGSVMTLAKRGDAEGAKAAMLTAQESGLLINLKNGHDAFVNARKSVNAILDNPTMSASDKYQLAETVHLQTILMARENLKMLDSLDKKIKESNLNLDQENKK